MCTRSAPRAIGVDALEQLGDLVAVQHTADDQIAVLPVAPVLIDGDVHAEHATPGRWHCQWPQCTRCCPRLIRSVPARSCIRRAGGWARATSRTCSSCSSAPAVCGSRSTAGSASRCAPAGRGLLLPGPPRGVRLRRHPSDPARLGPGRLPRRPARLRRAPRGAADVTGARRARRAGRGRREGASPGPLVPRWPSRRCGATRRMRSRRQRPSGPRARAVIPTTSSGIPASTSTGSRGRPT